MAGLTLVCGLLWATACLPRLGSITPPLLPDFLLGAFTDDYENDYAISPTEWAQLPGTRYHIERWNVGEQYLIARNDSGNPGDGGLWTRIDWLQLTGMPPYRWAFCYTAFRAESAQSAEATPPARRSEPRTGCNGFPFSRMRRTDAP